MDKKWDLEAIDHVYENLIDGFRHQLDSIVLSGFRIQLEKQVIFKRYLSLLERLEQELLIQWNIKQSQGVDALLLEQNSWLSRELRRKKSLFDDWAEFCSLLWNQSRSIDTNFHPSVWKSFVIKNLIQQVFWGEVIDGFKTDQKELIVKKCCQLLEILSKANPHHQILSFLNLIELGTHNRPLVCEIGKITAKAAKSSLPKLVTQTIIPAINKNDWEKIPQLLSQYWQKSENAS